MSFALAYFLPLLPSDLLTSAGKLVVFAVAYFTIAPVLGAVNVEDLNLVQNAVGDMKFIGGVLDPFFRYQRRLAGLAVRS